jgi:hypothetical protein
MLAFQEIPQVLPRFFLRILPPQFPADYTTSEIPQVTFDFFISKS